MSSEENRWSGKKELKINGKEKVEGKKRFKWKQIQIEKGLKKQLKGRKKEQKQWEGGKDGSAVLPPFCPSVLKPGLHLCVRHLQGLGQGGSLGRRQVLLPVEALLQLADLHPAEGRARLFPLGRRPVLVRVSDSAGHGERREGGCRRQGRKAQRGEERSGVVWR